MEPIEQARIFFTRTQDGFLLDKIRTSSHILGMDLDEILGWAESLKMPASRRFNPMNLLFHPLPSGRFGLGRVRSITPSGGTVLSADAPVSSEESLFVWQYAVIDPERLLLFGNNPITLFERLLCVQDLPAEVRGESENAEKTLSPFMVEADGRFFNSDEIRPLAVTPGLGALSVLVESVLLKPFTQFTGSISAPHLVSGLLNLLPIDYRTEISVSCELEFRGNPALRAAGFSHHQGGEINAVHRLDLDQVEFPRTLSGWSRFVYEVLRSGAFDFFEKKLLAGHLEVRRSLQRNEPYIPPCTETLHRMGNRARQELAQFLTDTAEAQNSGAKSAAAADSDRVKPPFRVHSSKVPASKIPLSLSEKLHRWLMEEHSGEAVYYEHHGVEEFSGQLSEEKPRLTNDKPPIARIESNAPPVPKRIPHEEPLLVFEGRNRLFSPYQQLSAFRPDREQDLLELDSLVGRTLTGDRPASNALLRCWERILSEGDNDFIDAVREEYIRFIRSTLLNEGPSETGEIARTVAACDILDMFLNAVPDQY